MADTRTKSVKTYVETTLRALDLEICEGLKQRKNSHHKNQVLKSLAIVSCNFAPYGFVSVNFRNSCKRSLGTHSFRIGGRVMVKVQSTLVVDDNKLAGCVENIQTDNITIAFGEIELLMEAPMNLFDIEKIVDEVTYNRMKTAIIRLVEYPSETESFTTLLFSSKKLEQIPLSPAILDSNGKIMFSNPALKPTQKEAIKFVLQQKHLGIIHGPPGTGKTTILSELILQLVKSGEKVLVCAPSNVAVDNIMAKLHELPLKCVRLGHPSRVSEENRPLTLMAFIKANLVAKGRHEKMMASDVLLEVDVCFATLGSSYRENILGYFPEEFFSSLVIDEASQCLESGCWMAIPLAKRCILAGDHHQLSPVILSQEAAQLGLSTTLMERAIDKLGSDCVTLLSHQFRMNQKIMDWVSRETYGGQLTADSSVANHLLVGIPGVEETDETNTPLLLVDTSGCSLREHCFHLSYGNSGEADLVAHMANLMVKAGVTRKSIAIITPYNRQVDLVKTSLANLSIGDIEVKTVDGFQGRESEAVILSLVRSNSRGELGFVSDKRRINVAVSRARRLLCVIADSSTVGKDKTIASLIEHIRQYGQVRSAHEV